MDVECQRLLSQLKSTVEQICNVEFSNGTSQGTLSDLYEAVASIFKHECKMFDRHVSNF